MQVNVPSERVVSDEERNGATKMAILEIVLGLALGMGILLYWSELVAPMSITERSKWILWLFIGGPLILVRDGLERLFARRLPE